MSRTKILSILIVALLGMAANVPALANGGSYYRSHAHFGFYFGAPAYWYYPSPYYYYPPAYYYPPVGAAPTSPAMYVERDDARAGPEQARDYWYYCPETQAYYPYVKQCAKGWQKVPPQPQN